MIEFSICVPTRNRAHLLRNFFTELRKQDPKLFELVIVNDGSTDDTSDVLCELARSAEFVVRPIDQAHGGRARALNRALDAATGRFVVILGDDDALVPGALQRMLAVWETIPTAEKGGFCGVCGLSVDQRGRILGDKFPQDVVDSDFFQMRVVASIRGDKREAVLRSVIGGYRFKVFDHETRVPTSSLWLHLAKTHKVRFVNESWCVMTYLPGGMTKSLAQIRISSARSTATHYRDVLDDFPDMPTRLKVRYAANLVRYSIHAGQRLGVALRGLSPVAAASGTIVGVAAAASDRAALVLRRLRHQSR
jgi:glycosyltransferase involved in cell wall biosynthesis